VAKPYYLNLRTKSPLIITSKQLGKILYNEFNYIPGYTLRGAIIAELYRRGNMNILSETYNPTLIVKPAYPIIDGNLAEPAHPFIFKCKLCKSLGESNYIFLSEGYITFVEKGIVDPRKMFPTSCSKGHKGTIKSLSGSLIVADKSIKEVKIDNVSLDAVGISKKTKSSEIGMLYNYVGIAPETRFRSVIICEDDMLQEIKKLNEIHIGRGISRGLGRVEISIEEYKENEEKRISKLISSGRLIIKAISPVFKLCMKDNGLHSEFDLDLPLKKKEFINNDSKVLTGITKVSGFSFFKNNVLPKPLFFGAKEGSIFFYEVSNVNEQIVKDIASYEIAGIPPFNYAGINHFKVIEYV
jgi:CRISPR/Cas system CSM-associated protein Csm3 (group 7 of RAMP superfamily)